MTTHTDYLWFNTTARHELINIAERIAAIVATVGVREGMCLVSAMHITAGIWVNDEESGLKHDVMEWLEQLAPAGDYRHHLKAIAPTPAIARLAQLRSPCAASRRHRAFPTPAQIVRVGEDVLRERARLGHRATFIGRLAREVCEGLRDLDQLDEQAARTPLDDLTAELADVRGMEPSAVDWLLLLLGRYESAGGSGPWHRLTGWFQNWLASDPPGVQELRRAHR